MKNENIVSSKNKKIEGLMKKVEAAEREKAELIESLKTTPDTMGGRLAQCRRIADVTRVQVAKDLKTSRTSLQYWEQDLRVPDAVMVGKLAKYYNVSCDYIILGDESKKPEINLK